MLSATGRVDAQQTKHGNTKKLFLKINPDSSSLRIDGTTNVNTFTCRYTGTLNTDKINIKIVPTDSTKRINGAHLKLKVEDFDCGKQKMNEDFHDLLKADKNPFIYLDVAELWQVRSDSGGSENRYATKTIFTIAGVTNNYKVDSGYQAGIKSLKAYGQYELDITEFGLEPPKKFLGLVKVDQNVTIVFSLYLSLHEAAEEHDTSP